VDPTGTAGTDSSLTLRVGLALSELSVPALWHAYAREGGGLPYLRIEDALIGRYLLDLVDHDILARVLNHVPALQGTGGVVRYSPDLDHDPHHS
jgi:hypothetical protein